MLYNGALSVMFNRHGGSHSVSIPVSARRDTFVQKEHFCAEESQVKKEMFEGGLGLIWLCAQR